MLRILVVDDEPTARDIMVKFLNKKENGIQIIGTASDGYEAMDLILGQMPDIVIIDIEMPGISGLDVITKVRSFELPISFIIISSHSKFKYAQAAIKLDVEEYILKPFLPTEICNAVYLAAQKLTLKKQFYKDVVDSSDVCSIFQHLINNININIPLEYPFKNENSILQILNGDADTIQIDNVLDEFYHQIFLDNNDESAQIACLSILFVELYHFVIKNGLKIDSLDLSSVQDITLSQHQRYFSIIKSFCRSIVDSYKPTNTAKSNIAMAKNYISSHYSEHISLIDVSNYVGLSQSYLSNLFMQTMGIHFIDYLNTVRITKAQEIILSNPCLKNYEVGIKVGYTSEKYFSRIFKKTTGITVSQFRSAH